MYHNTSLCVSMYAGAGCCRMLLRMTCAIFSECRQPRNRIWFVYSSSFGLASVVFVAVPDMPSFACHRRRRRRRLCAAIYAFSIHTKAQTLHIHGRSLCCICENRIKKREREKVTSRRSRRECICYARMRNADTRKKK